MSRRQTRSDIVALLERHGLQARKAYGQHFLADANLVDKIVALAGVGPGDRAVEVGAGTGALTVTLAATGARVVAYEVDERFRPVLTETLEGTAVEVRFEDVMKVDWSSALEDGPWTLVANLPYNVGTPLVLELLLAVPQVGSLVVMLQKEVADRLLAEPGTPEYGVPSVVVSLTATISERFEVPPQVFVPAPPVSSTVMHLDRADPPDRLGLAVDLARAAFGQRRKMLRRSLVERVSPQQMNEAGIDPSTRPEDMAPSDFVALAEVIGA